MPGPIIPIAVSAMLLGIVSVPAPSEAPEPGSVRGPFSVTYLIQHDPWGTSILYEEAGVLTESIACAGEWIDGPMFAYEVPDPTHFYRIQVDTITRKYVIVEQVSNRVTEVERVCSTGAEIVPLPNPESCIYGPAWTANAAAPGASPPLAPGWNARGGSDVRLATGTFDSVTVRESLPVHNMRQDYSAVVSRAAFPPFTGRLYFQDHSTGHDLYWYNFLGGRCLQDLPGYGSGVASPMGCCSYRPNEHDITYGVRSTSFGARPFGGWQIGLQACEEMCESVGVANVGWN